MSVNKERPPFTPNETEIKIPMGSIRALHTLLWHIRDEMGNQRAKDRLSEAIKMLEDSVGAGFTTEMENLIMGKT
jgi:hypothetical protein